VAEEARHEALAAAEERTAVDTRLKEYYSFFLILMYATSGSLVANSISYVLGPDASWMTSHKPLILALNVAFFAAAGLIDIDQQLRGISQFVMACRPEQVPALDHRRIRSCLRSAERS
jgi:hypothetical protein